MNWDSPCEKEENQWTIWNLNQLKFIFQASSSGILISLFQLLAFVVLSFEYFASIFHHEYFLFSVFEALFLELYGTNFHHLHPFLGYKIFIDFQVFIVQFFEFYPCNFEPCDNYTQIFYFLQVASLTLKNNKLKKWKHLQIFMKFKAVQWTILYITLGTFEFCGINL